MHFNIPDIFWAQIGHKQKEIDAMNIGERIALLQEQLKFEGRKQEVLYTELQRLCDPWPDDLKNLVSSEERQELITLNQVWTREESKALARGPEFLTWKSARETGSNLGILLCSLRKTNDIVERIIEIMKKAKR